MIDLEAPPPSVQETASSIFEDISNPAVEEALKETNSTVEVVREVTAIPAVSDFKLPDAGTTHVDAPVVTAPAAVVAPTAAPVVPAQVAVAPVVSPVVPQYTPEQLIQFQQWQAAQQQQVVAPVQQQTPVQQQAPVQLSPQELDKALNRYTVPVEEFNNLFTETDPVKATAILNNILEKKVVQAVTMANHLIQEAQSQITNQVRPYMGFADSQRELMLREQFFASNPSLKGQDLLIQTVMAQMAQERQAGVYKPASEQQVFSDVAARTNALIAGMQQNGPVASTQPGQQPAVQAGGKPAMAVLPSGGGGGAQSAAGSTARTGESQTAREIFG